MSPMHVVTAIAKTALLIGKVHPLSAIALVWLVIAAGCSLGPSRSQVIERHSAAGAESQHNEWLESATVTYARRRAHKQLAGATQASYAEPAVSDSTLRVLGIRYPHPNGETDVARVEVVIADASAGSSEDSWLSRLGKELNDTLPGVSWGDGIRQAKALDMPVAELKKLLPVTQNAAGRASIGAEDLPGVHLRMEINKQYTQSMTTPIFILETLADRVQRQGRLITYDGTAEQLQAAFALPVSNQLARAQDQDHAQRTNSTALATHQDPIPLPPIDNQ